MYTRVFCSILCITSICINTFYTPTDRFLWVLYWWSHLDVWDLVQMLGCTITEACKYLNESWFGCEILGMWLLLPHLIISVQRTASWSSISLSLYWLRSISTRAISTRVNRRLCVMATSSCRGDEYCTTEPHRTEQNHKTQQQWSRG